MAVREYTPERPWERQPCDTDLSWDLFQGFLALPHPRRLVDLVRRAAPHYSWARLQELAWEDAWSARAELWDRHLDRIRTETVEQVTREDAKARAERHGALARELQELGRLELRKLLTIARRPDGMPGLIAPRDLIRAVTLGIRTERLALGESTEKVDSGPDLSALGVDELRALRALQEKVQE